ncbi:MAG: FAD-dependent monooxygenase [Treponema sp.]|jgi:flavin-dependent dehydrogenase|nr:FAD-dependent monooxygenase [Treponema sp.]
MEKTVDILVIGGCSAGLYFAGLMARQGFRVLVCEKSSEEKLGDRYNIIHIAKEQFGRFGLHEPGKGDPEYVAEFSRSIQKSALNKWPKNSYTTIKVLRRGPLMRRLANWAREQGAEILFETSFGKPLYDEKNILAGAVFQSSGNELHVHARLSADASGIPAALRTSLPSGYGVENFVTGPRDMFYVALHYVNLKHPETDKVETNTTWTQYKVWLAPQHETDGAIIGVGANLSYEYAENVFRRFEAKGYLPEYELDHIEKGCTPYRRPPYSFVADGCIALGDAACLTNPWSGEGVPYAWLLCKIAAEEYGRIMKDGGVPSAASAWNINLRYIREQGALFAKNLAMLCGATDCTDKENDYEYKHSIIYEDDAEKGKHNLALGLLGGLLSGGISVKSLGNLLNAAGIGGKIEKHYLKFPDSPAGLAAWSARADALWAQAGSMADMAEKDLNRAAASY